VITAGVEEVEPFAFQVGLTLALESCQVLSSRQGSRRRFDMSPSKLQQQMTDMLTIQKAVVWLVDVAHQASIACGLTIFTGAGGTPQVITRLRIKMAQSQGLLGNSREGLWIIQEATQDASAAFSRLIEEQDVPIIARWQRFGCQFRFFELILDLDGMLERGLERRHDLGLYCL
jgi:hypothetical protein